MPEYDLSPTQSAFVHDATAHIVIFIGAMGEGKTYAGVIAMIAHAHRCGKPIRCAIIRDTHQNIKTSTVPSIREILGTRAVFSQDSKKLTYSNGRRRIFEADLFGIDDPAAIQKLQGPEYSLIWLEEPAPILDRANAGLSRDVLDMAIARSARQKGTAMRVQITQNPADEDHWTAELAKSPDVYYRDEESGVEIRKRVYRAKYGENKYLNAHTRAANKAAFQNDPGKFARYVKGVEAPVNIGKRVLENYNPDIHFLDDDAPVIPEAPGFRWYDAWHHPVCIVGQFLPPGRVVIHAALQGDGIAMKELILEQVRPFLSRGKWSLVQNWRDIGDPTMATPDQSTVSNSTAKTVEQELKTRFERGPVRWEHRYDPTRTALSRMASDGKPLVTVTRGAYNLHRALNGGWHWKTDNSGRPIGAGPVKDRAGDLGDAFCYGVAVTFPSREREARKPVNHDAAKRMAASYATGRRQGDGNIQKPLGSAKAGIPRRTDPQDFQVHGL